MKASRTLLILGGILTVSFQNCGGQVGFQTQPSEQRVGGLETLVESLPGESESQESELPAQTVQLETEGNLTEAAAATPQTQEMPPAIVVTPDPVAPTPPAPVNPPPTESPMPNTPVVVIDNNQNLNQPVTFAACQSFVELTESNLISLPPRESGSTCYFVRLMSAISNRPSGSAGELRAQDVLASNHNGNSSSYISPFILGERALQIHNLKNWKLAISGSSSNPNADMKIDNFFLLQLAFNNMDMMSSLVSAFGTADAEPGRTQPILVNNQPVPFQSFAPGGTAVVTALDLTPPRAITDTYTGFYQFRFRALDCGGSAAGSDVFAVFH